MTPDPNEDPTDAVLLDALAPEEDQLLTLDELAATSNISPVVISMLVREGWIVPRRTTTGDRYDRADLLRWIEKQKRKSAGKPADLTVTEGTVPKKPKRRRRRG